jgi:glycosyltransferase involved in cell wall biosynthesis
MGSIEVPSSRYRVYEYLPLLQRYGINYTVIRTARNSIGSRILFAMNLCYRLLWADIVFAQKNIPTKRIRKVMAIINKNVVFDFDDAIWTENTSKAALQHQNASTDMSARATLIEFIQNHCAAVIAGNQYLAEFAQAYISRVYVLPTVINTQLWQRGNVQHKDKVIIGWIGTADNLFCLSVLVNVFRLLHAKYRNKIVLKVICDLPLNVSEGFEVINRRWSLDSEIADLSECDIGVMPLEDDEWTRGKCGFKVIQYMSMGIAVVASPVGVNSHIIQDGVTGFLVRTEMDWVEKLSMLIENDDLRQRMGRMGRERVEASYSLHKTIEKFVSILEEIRES